MKSTSGSQVRIIAGLWRGRKIPVLDVKGLRPTPDRIRETLFNWLGDKCRNAVVLDCFAGSGALGFEACSRGAAQVTLVEKDKQAARNLQIQADRLASDKVELFSGDVLDLLQRAQKNYHIVFIDPPYAKPELKNQVLGLLVKNQCLADGAYIYLEWPVGEDYQLPADEFTWLKQKNAGQVYYAIAEWQRSR